MLLTMPLALLSPPVVLSPPFPGAMPSVSSRVCRALQSPVWWERGCSDAAPGWEGWDVNADGSFYMCQVLFPCSPQRQVLPSSRPASLQLVPGQMLPAGGSPGPARAPSLITPGLVSSSPHPLPPHPRALLSYQPAPPGAASLQRHPNPSSCAESQLGAALCTTLALQPANTFIRVTNVPQPPGQQTKCCGS